MAILTQKLATVVALEVAKKAAFLKVGSKDHFSSQINGKMKAGQSYDFIIPDAGNVAEGLTINPRAIDERKVTLTIEGCNNSVETGALEGITDLKWEEEIASQYAAKLANYVINKKVNEASVQANTVFVGEGFAPIAQAGAYLQSISTEDLTGFIDPMAQAVLAANGQQFVPNGAPGDLYGKGKLGLFQGVDYTAERFLKPVVISASEVSAMANKTAVSYTPATGVLVLSGNVQLKKGTPIFLEGVNACDTIGDETATPFAFIVAEDMSEASTDVKVQKNLVSTDCGARSFVGTIASAAASIPAAGTYRLAYIRANGAYNFSEVKELDIKLSDKGAVGDVDGVRISVNSFTNGTTAKNTTRWDWNYLAGTIEPRLVSLAYFKA